MPQEAVRVFGRVHSIESFGLVDGPGVRSVVFLQGCPMRCAYCHNPDSWSFDAPSSQWEAGELLEKLTHFKSYWGNNGGITVSGGEPLAQAEFVTELFRLAKEKGIHTALDTSGILFSRDEPFFSKFAALMKYTDLVLLDIKHTDTEKHKKLTGFGNEAVLGCAGYLSETKKPVWLRRVLVPGVTDDPDELKELKKFIDGLENVERVEILPYHTMALPKYEKLGIKYPLEGVPVPTEAEVKEAKKILGIK